MKNTKIKLTQIMQKCILFLLWFPNVFFIFDAQQMMIFMMLKIWVSYWL